MLSKENRLTKEKEFENVFKKGKVLKEKNLVLKFVKNDLKKNRFGFIVSQKVSKKAVVRNKVKRRLRQIMRKKMKKIKKGLDLVFVALPGIEKLGFSEVNEIIENILNKSQTLIKK
jgi:ribonuclease P protein component